jgi:prevent-host-death family protein
LGGRPGEETVTQKEVTVNMIKAHQLHSIPEVVSLTDLRSKTSQLVRQLSKENNSLLLVNRTVPVGVILPIDLYQEILADLKHVYDQLGDINLREHKLTARPLDE